MVKWIYLGIGGLGGTFLRYILARNINQFTGGQFPYGTLVVNLLGCFLVGVFAILADKKLAMDANMKLLFMIGFCGAFTTFSTFIFETSNLINDGQMLRALANILISVIVGFFVFRLGLWVGELI